MKDILTKNIMDLKFGKRAVNQPNILGQLLLLSNMEDEFESRSNSEKIFRTKRNFFLKKKRRII